MSHTWLLFTNYQVSDHFCLGRGTRQWFPLSPLLFSIAFEPLAIALRQDDRTEGIIRGGQTYKVSLYADGLLFFLAHNDTTLPHVFYLLSSFVLLVFSYNPLFPPSSHSSACKPHQGLCFLDSPRAV